MINVSVELPLFKLQIRRYEDAVVMSCLVKVLLLYFRCWGYLFAQMHLALLKAEKSNEENKAQLDTFMRCFETLKSWTKIWWTKCPEFFCIDQQIIEDLLYGEKIFKVASCHNKNSCPNNFFFKCNKRMTGEGYIPSSFPLGTHWIPSRAGPDIAECPLWWHWFLPAAAHGSDAQNPAIKTSRERCP